MTNNPLKIVRMESTEAQNNVNIVIGIKYTHTIIDFLLQNHISFYMSTVDNNVSAGSRQVDVNNQIPTIEKNDEPSHTNLIDKAFQKYILNNLEGFSPDLDEIAKELKMSKQTFKNRFKELYGIPFYQAFLQKKMEHAANLLKQGHSATTISNRIGYSHPIKFNKMFQKHYGITPKKYQLQHSSK